MRVDREGVCKNLATESDGGVGSGDRLKPGLKLVFCGTAAGAGLGLRAGLLRPQPEQVLDDVAYRGADAAAFRAAQYELLWEHGIGLTDIAKHVYGMDHQLPKDALGDEAAAALRARILRYPAEASGLHQPRHMRGRKVMGPRARAESSRKNWHRRASSSCRRHPAGRQPLGHPPPGRIWRAP